jgi:hypothetical protein
MPAPASLLKCLFIAATAALVAPSFLVHAQETKVLLYVGATTESAWQGVQQGLEEANQLGQFTGQRYRLEQARDISATQSLEFSPAVAILAALDAEKLRSLANSRTTSPPIPVFNLTAEEDSLRRDCLPNVFHIIPSQRMKADALGQWRQKHPQASVTAQAWHPEFKKFAAEELNKRFRKARGFAMDDHAWAGWAAVKLLADGVARIEGTEPEKLSRYLFQEIQFDAQKGMPSSFRDTGQMRQILLLVEDGKLVGEAPVPGVVDVTDLDSLGLPSCP